VTNSTTSSPAPSTPSATSASTLPFGTAPTQSNSSTGTNVVLDPVTPLEDGGGGRYVKFLDGLQRHLSNVGGLGLLVAPTAEDGSRSRQHTLGVADLVRELRTDASAGPLETCLVVREFRGGEVPDEPVSLDLGRRVRVDTSRDIA
jgi:hypothetical protein